MLEYTIKMEVESRSVFEVSYFAYLSIVTQVQS